jgi:hypothetical protein
VAAQDFIYHVATQGKALLCGKIAFFQPHLGFSTSCGYSRFSHHGIASVTISILFVAWLLSILSFS